MVGNEEISVTDKDKFLEEFDPSNYGFVHVKNGRHEEKGPGAVWRKGIFVVIRLSKNLWVCKKKLKNERNNTEYAVKWHMIIDSSDIAAYLFSEGLRG